MAFVVLALTNIATGMFVQASLGAHEKQREKDSYVASGTTGFALFFVLSSGLFRYPFLIRA